MNEQWRPIEDAPVEGQWALVSADGAMNCMYVKRGQLPEDWTHATHPNVIPSWVTHWMPLPEPPLEIKMNRDEALDDMLNGVSDGGQVSGSETTEHYDRVLQFMELAGQSVPDEPTEMDKDTRELRARLLLEECFETIIDGLGVDISHYAFPVYEASDLQLIALDDSYNPVELLDGCCDLNVITTGTLIAAGIADAEPQRLVDENNLAKFGEGHKIREDGKLIKPPNHRPPDLAGELERQRNLYEASHD